MRVLERILEVVMFAIFFALIPLLMVVWVFNNYVLGEWE